MADEEQDKRGDMRREEKLVVCALTHVGSVHDIDSMESIPGVSTPSEIQRNPAL